MEIKTFFDPATFTLSYVVFDAATKDAVVIDPVLDYDPLTSSTTTAGVDALERFIRDTGLKLHWVLETHAHADHLTAAQVLKRRCEAGVVAGRRITEVQETFHGLFGGFATDGSQFDRLVADGETLMAGALAVKVLETPGHTPACVSYLIGDAVFTGDALFIEDYGTGRCDFPRGDAAALYHSVHDVLYALLDATRVFVGHDYQPDGRPLRCETTIGRSKALNIQLRAETRAEDFVAMRRARDVTLRPPRLLYQSIQVNVDAGRLPAPDARGQRFLRIPLTVKQPSNAG
ncbi:MAG: MBL fold metallo-hydrolase [Myxococcota bacterium]